MRSALAEALPAAMGSMRLYLPHPATRAILFKPIKSNIAEAHGQVRAASARGGGGKGEQSLLNRWAGGSRPDKQLEAEEWHS